MKKAEEIFKWNIYHAENLQCNLKRNKTGCQTEPKTTKSNTPPPLHTQAEKHCQEQDGSLMEEEKHGGITK